MKRLNGDPGVNGDNPLYLLSNASSRTRPVAPAGLPPHGLGLTPPATVNEPAPVIVGATSRMAPPLPAPPAVAQLSRLRPASPPFARIVPLTPIEIETELAIRIAPPPAPPPFDQRADSFSEPPAPPEPPMSGTRKLLPEKPPLRWPSTALPPAG